ncbi:hypothetical protein L204_104930 [Cryptococcus depauperatus]|nr:hypothetical protein L204_05437 [Cryptococcus depauperatus CBS 7855]
MPSLSQEFPTFGHYTCSLRAGLRQSTNKSLVELDEAIELKGYDWLEGYMAQIFSRVNQAPIGELIKTPSKTQTVKKTRAATAAAKEKLEKIRGLNAHLAPSPSKQNVRLALSPLQLGSRDTNVDASPSPSPLKSKALKEFDSVKPKAKRGRPKKIEVADENAQPLVKKPHAEVSQASERPSRSSRKGERAIKASISLEISKREESKSSRLKRNEDLNVIMPPSGALMEMPEVAEISRDKVEMPEVGFDLQSELLAHDDVNIKDDAVIKEVDEAIVRSEDGYVIIDDNSQQSMTFVQKKQSLDSYKEEVENIVSKTSSAVAVEETKVEIAPIPIVELATESEQDQQVHVLRATSEATIVLEPTATVANTEPTIAELIAVSQGSEDLATNSFETTILKCSVPSSHTVSSASSTLLATSTSLPVRQVRSSWLSKALGTGTVPISGAKEQGVVLRSSCAAPVPPIHNPPMDFSGLRKSLVPLGGLKRKSEGLDERNDGKDDPRPEKVAKSSESHTVHFPTTTPGPVIDAKLPSKTPSFGAGSIGSNPNSQDRSVSGLFDDSLRPNITKVTKALDELREKTAKNQAKQRASTAIRGESSSARLPMAKGTGTGFLRGLLNFGGATEEEECARKARELEQERLAEEELERLMWNATKPIVDPEAVIGESVLVDSQSTIDSKEVEKDVARSTTPVFSPPPKFVSHPSALTFVSPKSSISHLDKQNEELIDEESVLGDIVPEEITESERNFDLRYNLPMALSTNTETASLEQSNVRPSVSVQTHLSELHERREVQHHISASMQREKENHDREEQRANAKELKMESASEENANDEKQEIAYQKDQKAKTNHREDRTVEQKEAKVVVGNEWAAPMLKNDRRDREEGEEAKIPSTLPESSQLSNAPTSASMLTASTSSSVITNVTFNHASSIAAKVLGVKPAVGPVKSLQLAAATKKKEQAAVSRKAAMKDQVEKRRELLAQKKTEEERSRDEEERKAKVAEIEQKRRQRAEQEKRKKEREARVAAIAKEKAAREEKEMLAAKAKQTEEDVARKRKLAATLSKSQPGAPSAKRVAGAGQVQSTIKGKEPFRPTKTTSAHPLSISSTEQKLGPTSFRTAEVARSQTSTITLVKQSQRESQAERKPLGQPSRPSAMEHMTIKHQQHQYSTQRSSAIPQNWSQIQSSLDEKAALQQSEDIVLPDIASEYSDPDDDTPRDFNRPAWAESPELRKALEAQAHINPDELFGPIKPLNMDELFKARQGKFRARTSSANWSKGDGLTKAEEAEYARRMGFTSLTFYDEHGGSRS